MLGAKVRPGRHGREFCGRHRSDRRKQEEGPMDDRATAGALGERLFGACLGALDLLHVYVGDRLGLCIPWPQVSADLEVLPIENDFWQFYLLNG